MAFTKIVGAGIHTLSNVHTHNINSSGIITATSFVGPFNGSDGDFSGNVTIDGNLIVNGDTTTLNTTLREVEILRVDANNSTVGAAITQSGSGDILNLYDGSTEVFSVADGGNVSIAGLSTHNEGIFLPDEKKAEFGNTAGSGDLQIYHSPSNSNNSFIKHTGSGALKIAADHFRFRNAADNANLFNGLAGDKVTLYFAGNEKLSTTSDGIEIPDAIRHLNDTNTAIRFPADDTISFETSGSQHLRVASNGNIGIGTGNNNPTSKLHVLVDGVGQGIHIANKENLYNAASTGYSDIRFSFRDYQTGGSSGAPAIIRAQSHNAYATSRSSKLIFLTSSSDGTNTPTEKMRIEHDGDVGIGTDNPAFKLDLRNTGQADLLIGSYNAGGARLMLDGDSNGDGSGGDFCEIMADTGGDLTINARNPADDAELILKTGGGTEAFRIDSNGHTRFGPSGAASDSIWSHSNWGNTEVAIDSPTGYAVLHFRGEGAGTTMTRYAMGVGNDTFYMAYDDVDGRHNLVVTGAGTVGINNQTPNSAFKLDVNGGVNVVGDIALPTTNRIYFGNSDVAFIKGEHGGSGYLAFGANNEKMRLTRTGRLGIGTDNPTTALDVRDASGSDPTFFIGHSEADVIGEAIRIGRVSPYHAIRYHSIKAEHSGGTASNMLAFHLHSGGSGTTDQVEVMRLRGDGRIGFGEDSPSRKFSFAYTDGTNFSSSNAVYDFLLWNKANISSYPTCGASIQLRAGNTSAGGGNITGVRRGGANQGDLAFSTTDASGNPVEAVRITSAGKVCVNLVSSLPNETIHIQEPNGASVAGVTISHLSGGNRYGARLQTINGTNRGLIISNLFNSAYGEVVRINNNGQVLIGENTSPDSKLHITNGTLKIETHTTFYSGSGENGENYPSIFLNADHSSGNNPAHGKITVRHSNQNTYSGDLVFMPQGYYSGSYGYQEVMRVSAYKRVGINVTPSATLHVVNNSSDSTIAQFGKSSDARYARFVNIPNQENFNHLLLSKYNNGLEYLLRLQNTDASGTNQGTAIQFIGHGGSQTGLISVKNRIVNSSTARMHFNVSGDDIMHMEHAPRRVFVGEPPSAGAFLPNCSYTALQCRPSSGNTGCFAGSSKSYTTNFGILPWSGGGTYLSSGTTYNNGVWNHQSNDSTNCLLYFRGNGFFWYSSNNSSSSWNVFSGGQVMNSVGQWTGGTSSDRRLKNNITNMSTSDALTKVTQLQGVSYTWKDEIRKKYGTGAYPEGTHYGFIAQDVKTVWPEAHIISDVDNESDFDDDPTKDVKDDVYYGEIEGVKMEKMVPLLVEAIKELKKENDALKARISALESS